jgi:hypothetical protein
MADPVDLDFIKHPFPSELANSDPVLRIIFVFLYFVVRAFAAFEAKPILHTFHKSSNKGFVLLDLSTEPGQLEIMIKVSRILNAKF